jgi:hypothetical protein
MTIFAVIAPDPDPKLEPAVREAFPDSFYKINPSQFLVSAAKLTTNQVAEKIGAPNGGVGRVLIARISTYTGWHTKDMWEWLAAQTNPLSPTLFDPPEPTNE